MQTKEFISFFTKSLSESTFEAFKFETPPISRTLVDNNFEYIIVQSKHLVNVTPDTASFREHWNK